MEESLFVETTRVPALPCRTVRETRSGGVDATRLLLKVSLGADFKACHFSPASAVITRRPLRPLDAVGERIPCSRFKGVLPLASSGCMGTIPTVLLLLRTKTAVTG